MYALLFTDKKIDMTAPVVQIIKPGQGPACSSDFYMSFYMSPKVRFPPRPIDKTVDIKQLPSFMVYVR